jgi:predicted PurR-regulated permease PerM
LDKWRGDESRPLPSPFAGIEPANGEHVLVRRLASIEQTIRYTSIGALLILIVWLLRDILLLGFAAVLIACVLHGAADFLHRRSGLNLNWSLAAVICILVVLLTALFWWRGAEIVGQVQQLSDQLATQGERLWSQVEKGAWGRRAAEGLRHSIQSAADGLPGFATGVATSTLGIGGSLVVVVVTGLCLAASPQIYISGSLRLLPPEWRPRGQGILSNLARTLRLWCLGQLVDMAVVASLVGIGLFALGVPLALTLALFAGLLNFVPYIGALAGAVPAILVALAQSPTLALWVMLLFFAVQMIEGNVIAPFIQKRTGTLPPALTIVSQTILGTLFGALGLILATPFMAALLAATRMIYVESVMEAHDVTRDREPTNS